MNRFRFAAQTRHSAALLLALVATLGMAGCEAGPPDVAPSPGLGDPYPAPINDPQISVLSPELRPWIAFHPAIITQDGKRPMQVEVPLRNVTNRQYLIEYRILFYDEHGRELEPLMGWKFQSMDPKQVARLKAGALSTDAEDYRLEVRWSR